MSVFFYAKVVMTCSQKHYAWFNGVDEDTAKAAVTALQEQQIKDEFGM